MDTYLTSEKNSKKPVEWHTNAWRRPKRKNKECYDRKKIHREMEVGDKAIILLPSDSNKMLMHWKGPFMITAKRNEVDYELEVGVK